MAIQCDGNAFKVTLKDRGKCLYVRATTLADGAGLLARLTADP
jgi:hypothetical protein